MDEDDPMAARRRAEAAQWFARLKTLPVSQGTLRDFFAWKRLKENAEAFQEAERFWTQAGKLGESPSILRAVAAADGRRVVPRSFRHWTMLPGLAILLVAITAGFSYLTWQRTIFQTVPGEMRALTLEDGSRVQLGTATKIRVRYGPNGRQLTLQKGEALFNVAHDVLRPFTVAAGDVTVTATGTKFDVSRIDDRVSVTLLQGRVIVHASGGTALALRPGQQWRWPDGGAEARSVDAANVVAWTQGRIVFDDTALADAIATVNRYGGKPVSLDAQDMASERISGTFEAGDSQSFVTAVTAFLPLRQRIDERGNIHLVAGKQNSRENIPSS